MIMYGCQDCGWVGGSSALNEVRYLWERCEPGDVIPEGECPECGAMCFPVPSDEEVELERIRNAAPELLAALEECVYELEKAGLGCAGYTDIAHAAIAKAKGKP